MPPRVPDKERLRHKVLISLNDDQYCILLDEARERKLAPSIIGRLAFARGMPELRKKGKAVRPDKAGRKGENTRETS